MAVRQLKRKVNKSAPVLKIEEPIENLFEKYYALLAEVQSLVLGQDEVLSAVASAILLRQHCLLIGPAGEAKTMAARLFVRAFDEAKVFDRLMTAGTQPEELFGPMDLAAWRDEKNPRLQFKTEGYIPEADFAILDELFRAPNRLHSVLFRILNEREFDNGNSLMKVPLRSAVATTNFIPDDTELAAFIDRFPWTIAVNPLSTAKRRKLLPRLWENEDEPEQPVSLLSLAAMDRLRRFVFGVEVPEELVELFFDLLKNYSGPESSQSTRTLINQSGRLLQLIAAESVCYGTEPDLQLFKMFAYMWGVSTRNSRDLALRFETAFTSVIGQAETARRERRESREAYESFDWDSLEATIPSAGEITKLKRAVKAGKAPPELHERFLQLQDSLLKITGLNSTHAPRLSKDDQEYIAERLTAVTNAESELQSLVADLPSDSGSYTISPESAKGLEGFMSGISDTGDDVTVSSDDAVISSDDNPFSNTSTEPVVKKKAKQKVTSTGTYFD